MRLTTVTRTQGNNEALKDGRVTRRLRVGVYEVPVLIDAFRRMVRGLEYDVCELAATTYICAKAHGKRFTALPIFLVRAFHHGAILYNPSSGIRHPKDLEGTRVGVNRGYTVTTGVWARAVLQEEYGVDLSSITWVLSGDEHVAEVCAAAERGLSRDGQDACGRARRERARRRDRPGESGQRRDPAISSRTRVTAGSRRCGVADTIRSTI